MSDLKGLFRIALVYFKLPLTFSPVFPDSNVFAHVHPMFEVAFGYLAVTTGLVPILVHQVYLKLRAMVSRAYLLAVWQHFVILKYYSQHGFLSESFWGFILAWVLTGS